MPTLKYDENFVKKELLQMLDELNENKQIYLINQLFENKSYSRSRFHEWKTKFTDNYHIVELFEKIENTLEARIVSGALMGRLNSTMSIFVLKNKYG